MPTDESCKCGWIKLWHPRGVIVTLPVSAEKVDYAVMFANVTAAFDAGFLEAAPGLNAGEQRFEAVAVVRRSKTNRDDSESPMIDLYEHGNEYKSLTVYLDSDEEITAFQSASGMKLQDILLLASPAAPKRGDRQTDKFFAVPPKPFGVVFEPNPKYDQAAADKATQQSPYRIPKRIFLRWSDQKPASPTESGSSGEPSNTVQPTDDQVLATWRAFLKSDPSITDLNNRIAATLPNLPTDQKSKVWSVVKEHAKSAGLAWSDSVKGFRPAAMAGA